MNRIEFSLELLAVLRPAHQRHQEKFVDQPVRHEGDRHDDDEPDQRAHRMGGIEPPGAEGAGEKELAVGKVHDARDAVLEREPQCDHRVHASQNKSGDDDVYGDHVLPRRL